MSSDRTNDRFRRRHVIPGVWLPGWIVDPLRRCTHATNRRNIYGDEVETAGGNRSRCLDCGRLLPHLWASGNDAPRGSR